MNVTCPECESVFRVDPAKVPIGGVRARCSVCGGVMSVPAPEFTAASDTWTIGEASEAIGTPVAKAAPEVAAAWNRRTTPSDDIDSDAEAAPELATETTQPPATAYAAPSPAESRPAVTPRPPFTPRVRPAFFPGTTGASATAAPVAPAAQVRAMPATPPAVRAVPLSPNVVQAPTAPVRPQTPPAPVMEDVAHTTSVTTPVTPSVTAPGARRSINPFLANDPGQKAKRLARALVSDMVAYLPQKREEGLRNNTLKALFREEIKKSYEEYIDQIGRDLAESTTYFQDALNDVLSGGRKIF